MAILKEIEQSSSKINYGNNSFSSPDWFRINFPQPKNTSPFNPEIYLRKENIVGLDGFIRTITILDEKYEITDSNTVIITQYVLGHHPKEYLPKAQKHQGWQGKEMIRKFYRMRLMFGDGTKEIRTREIDLSQNESRNSNWYGSGVNS